MEERDFDWCYNHENLFREWLHRIYDNHIYDLSDLDSGSIFDCWQKAKEYALEIANSVEPQHRYRMRKTDMFTNFSHNTFLILDFLNTMLRSSKNKNLESFANFGKEQFKEHLSLLQIDANSIDEFDTKSSGGLNFAKLKYGLIESDYDYSLPDGGLTKADAGTAENNETLLEKLMPIFYGNKEQAEVYIKKFKNITNDVEKVQYTAQLVNENTISEMSCHRDLYSILHDHRLYNKSESNWNKVISQHIVKK